MELTFELPEGECMGAYGAMECPFLYDGSCQAEWGGSLYTDDYEEHRLPACPFHGVVTVTMTDEEAQP